jgi:energy-coupling factor transporter ATP-binding protein EcfA2
MDEIILIVGLPGSGKTYLARTLNHVVIDDITSLNEIPKYGNFVITDVNFCDEIILKRAIDYFKVNYPNHEIQVLYFENNSVKARANVEYRDDGRIVEGTIRRFEKIYNPPKNAIPIWDSRLENPLIRD